MFNIELTEKQLNSVLNALDVVLKTDGLKVIAEVSDVYNALIVGIQSSNENITVNTASSTQKEHESTKQS